LKEDVGGLIIRFEDERYLFLLWLRVFGGEFLKFGPGSGIYDREP